MKHFATISFRTGKNGAGKVVAQLPTILPAFYVAQMGLQIPYPWAG